MLTGDFAPSVKSFTGKIPEVRVDYEFLENN
jgi:hypothetical protein